MPRGSSNPPIHPAETPANLRDKAARARRLAEGTDPKTHKELTDFARELETKATELEPPTDDAGPPQKHTAHLAASGPRAQAFDAGIPPTQ
jgi:hypothetical protein